MSKLIVRTPPASEPVALEEARAHLRVEGPDEDGLIGVLITAARLHVESVTGRALVTTGFRLHADSWPPQGVFRLPRPPVSAVEAVGMVDADGAATPFSASDYDVDARAEPGIVALKIAPPPPLRPFNGVYVDFDAGYGAAADIPTPLRQAILLLVAHWFERREPLDGEGGAAPFAVDALTAPYRLVRL